MVQPRSKTFVRRINRSTAQADQCGSGSRVFLARAYELQRPRSGERPSPFQPKPAISSSNDVYEQEADRIADQVMRMSNPVLLRSCIDPTPIRALSLQRQCADCENEEQLQRKKDDMPAATSGDGLGSITTTLSQSGQPLDAGTRSFFEPRFGVDFSAVRIHTNTQAAESAKSINALAYTVGSNVVFNGSQYAPQSDSGKRLLAHELTHVVQQRGLGASRAHKNNDRQALPTKLNPAIASNDTETIARMTLNVGGVSANIDYGDVINTPAADLAATIASRFLAYTGVALSPALQARIAGISLPGKEWLLFGLDVLSENTAATPGLARSVAFERLLDRAPISVTHPLGSGRDFEREILTVSGWFEQAISRPLSAPSAAELGVIDPLLNPPPAAVAPAGGILDLVTLRAELPVLTRARLGLSAFDPANWPGTRVQSLAQVQSVGDAIQAQARTFFSPFSETARNNRWLAAWQYSANISSVTTDALGNPAPVPSASRLALLRNRAESAGWDDRAGDSLFSRTNFDSNRDAGEFESIIAAMDADPVVRATLERQFRHTAHLERPSLRVGISTEVSTADSECVTRWNTIRTLCHELMHSLAHPDFVNAISSSARFPTGVNQDQVLEEGFAEVLGLQLFNNLRTSANAVLLASLTSGVAGACPAPSAAAEPRGAYRVPGNNAERIRILLGDQRFRAAYFHGQTSLIGL